MTWHLEVYCCKQRERIKFAKWTRIRLAEHEISREGRQFPSTKNANKACELGLFHWGFKIKCSLSSRNLSFDSFLWIKLWRQQGNTSLVQVVSAFKRSACLLLVLCAYVWSGGPSFSCFNDTSKCKETFACKATKHTAWLNFRKKPRVHDDYAWNRVFSAWHDVKLHLSNKLFRWRDFHLSINMFGGSSFTSL